MAILAESAGDIGIVRLNDEKSLNAISPHMVEALLDAFRELSRSRRAIVLTGVGSTIALAGDLIIAPRGIHRKLECEPMASSGGHISPCASSTPP